MAAKNTLYFPVSGRSPKTLDPVVSIHLTNRLRVLYIYEPPYQYHYLKKTVRGKLLTGGVTAAPLLFDKAGS